MSQEIVRAILDAYNRRDLAAQLEHFAPEFEFETSGLFSDTAALYRGEKG